MNSKSVHGRGHHSPPPPKCGKSQCEALEESARDSPELLKAPAIIVGWPAVTQHRKMFVHRNYYIDFLTQRLEQPHLACKTQLSAQAPWSYLRHGNRRAVTVRPGAKVEKSIHRSNTLCIPSSQYARGRMRWRFNLGGISQIRKHHATDHIPR